MRMRWTASLVALFLAACSGDSVDRGRARVETAPEPGPAASAPSATPVSTPDAPRPSSVGGPDLSYAALDPKMEGELPIRWIPIFDGTPRTRLEDGSLWAPASAVVRVLASGAKVAFEGGRLKIDGQPVDTPARLENGEPWAAVTPLARHFGAYARIHQEDGSVAIWPRDALIWLRDHGDPRAPVLREAKAAGLLGSAG